MEEARSVSPGLLVRRVFAQALDLRHDLRHDRADELRHVVLDLDDPVLRPNTVWSVGEKLTLPDSVGTSVNFSIFAAGVAPFVEPSARLMAVTTPSIAAGPATKPPVPALTCFASLLTAGLGSPPNARRT